jgi:hypothetical protein
VALAVALMAAAAIAFVEASNARETAVAEASRRARVAAQTKLAPLLTESDLADPIVGARYDQLSDAVARSVIDRSRVDDVTIWSDLGRVIFARDAAMVGTRPTYIRDFAYGVAYGSTQTKVETGSVKTFTPIWREPGGTVVVAELDQPFGSVAGSSGRTFMLAALALGIGSIVCLVTFAVSWRRTSPAIGPPMAPIVPVRGAVSPTGARALGPVLGAAGPATAAAARATTPQNKSDAGLREAEQAKTDAEMRARQAEERLTRLQLQHQQAIDRLQALEERLSVAVAAPKHTQEELRALRDQVRESAERLLAAEAENEDLRARLGGAQPPETAPGPGEAQA